MTKRKKLDGCLAWTFHTFQKETKWVESRQSAVTHLATPISDVTPQRANLINCVSAQMNTMSESLDFSASLTSLLHPLCKMCNVFLFYPLVHNKETQTSVKKSIG